MSELNEFRGAGGMIKTQKVCDELQYIGEVYLNWLTARRETFAAFEVFKEWEEEDDLSFPTKKEWSDGKWKYFREYQAKIQREKEWFEVLVEQQDLALASIACEGFCIGQGEQHGAPVQFSREDQSGTCPGSNGVGNQGEKTDA